MSDDFYDLQLFLTCSSCLLGVGIPRADPLKHARTFLSNKINWSKHLRAKMKSENVKERFLLFETNSGTDVSQQTKLFFYRLCADFFLRRTKRRKISSRRVSKSIGWELDDLQCNKTGYSLSAAPKPEKSHSS